MSLTVFQLRFSISTVLSPKPTAEYLLTVDMGSKAIGRTLNKQESWFLWSAHILPKGRPGFIMSKWRMLRLGFDRADARELMEKGIAGRAKYGGDPYARDYYVRLGVEANATQDDIKNAFRNAAVELHPDTHRDDSKATEKFQLCAEAYEVLSDVSARRSYDMLQSLINRKQQPPQNTYYVTPTTAPPPMQRRQYDTFIKLDEMMTAITDCIKRGDRFIEAYLSVMDTYSQFSYALAFREEQERYGEPFYKFVSSMFALFVKSKPSEIELIRFSQNQAVRTETAYESFRKAVYQTGINTTSDWKHYAHFAAHLVYEYKVSPLTHVSKISSRFNWTDEHSKMKWIDAVSHSSTCNRRAALAVINTIIDHWAKRADIGSLRSLNWAHRFTGEPHSLSKYVSDIALKKIRKVMADNQNLLEVVRLEDPAFAEVIGNLIK